MQLDDSRTLIFLGVLIGAALYLLSTNEEPAPRRKAVRPEPEVIPPEKPPREEPPAPAPIPQEVPAS